MERCTGNCPPPGYCCRPVSAAFAGGCRLLLAQLSVWGGGAVGRWGSQKPRTTTRQCPSSAVLPCCGHGVTCVVYQSCGEMTDRSPSAEPPSRLVQLVTSSRSLSASLCSPLPTFPPNSSPFGSVPFSSALVCIPPPPPPTRMCPVQLRIAPFHCVPFRSVPGGEACGRRSLVGGSPTVSCAGQSPVGTVSRRTSVVTAADRAAPGHRCPCDTMHL